MVSGSRDKTVLMQDFWLDDADYIKKKNNQTKDLTKEQERMLRRKAVMDRTTAFPRIRRY